MVIVERARDAEWRRLASDVWEDLALRTAGRSTLDLNMDYDIIDDVELFYAPFQRLGVKLPKGLRGLQFAVGVLTADKPAASRFYPPGRFDYAPKGMLVVVTNNSWATEDVGDLVRLKKGQFIHEFVHALDVLHRSPGMLPHMERELERGKYWETEHELNAYLHQAFNSLVDELSEEGTRPVLRHDAELFAPDAEALWQKFLTKVRPQLLAAHGEDRLRRRWVARLVDMWHDYVQQLPASLPKRRRAGSSAVWV